MHKLLGFVSLGSDDQSLSLAVYLEVVGGLRNSVASLLYGGGIH